MIAASEKAARDEIRKHLQNKLNIKQMEFREGYHQMEERMVHFLCGVMKGLALDHKMHFVSLFKMLKDVTKWHSGFDWNLLCVGKEMPISRKVIAVPNATVVLLD
jgi:hypothetical protein